MASIRVATAPQQTMTTVLTTLPLWLTCGTAGAVLFAVSYLIEGATRTDCNPWQQAISVLSLGPGGWVRPASQLRALRSVDCLDGLYY
jgi:hypothetical protein